MIPTAQRVPDAVPIASSSAWSLVNHGCLTMPSMHAPDRSAPPELGLNKLYNDAVRIVHVEAVLNVFLWGEALRFQFARDCLLVEAIHAEGKVIDDPGRVLLFMANSTRARQVADECRHVVDMG